MKQKKLHYCWFGGNPKSELILKCIESWKRFCPDFEIVEWNENNFNIHSCPYVEEAYAAKKWAFVSDYARFWILYRHGGVYLDTDVELIRPLKELPDTFVGFENQTTVASGLIRGALPGDEICDKMLQSYHADRFIKADGTLNTMTVCERETNILIGYGLKPNGKLQTVNNTTVYPTEYFSPKDYVTQEINITDNTVSIHHYDASWYSVEDKYAITLRVKYCKWMPKRMAMLAAKFMAIKHFRGWRTAFAEGMRFLKRKKNG